MADRDTEISRDGTPGARTSIPGAEPSTRSRARRKLEVHTEPRVWLYPFLLLAGASVLVTLITACGATCPTGGRARHAAVRRRYLERVQRRGGRAGACGRLALGDAIGMVRASASERTSMRPSGNDANAPRAFRSLKL